VRRSKRRHVLFGLATAAAAWLHPSSVAADVVHGDDVIIDGSLCVGFDCVNGESFGFDTIRLKENNLRIKFQDTSSTASYPSNDWQITANDSSNGGLNKFSIDDIDGGRTPFTIEAGAPSHSLYVDDAGRLGLGTNTPVLHAHIRDGDTPALRFDQDGSSGFAPQIWDMAGNETNFFIRDVTNGSKLPFRIFPGAPSNSLFVASSGNVGLGTSSPDSLLDIEASGPQIRWTNTGGGGGIWDSFMNATTSRLNFSDDPAHSRIPFKMAPGANHNLFWIGISGSDAVDVNGTLKVNGSVVVDGVTVHPDYVFDPTFDLQPIDEHAALMWQKRHLPGVPGASNGNRGPVDLVKHQMGILEELETAHIYIEQLHVKLEQLTRRVEELEAAARK
jgi:hypothetical protein